ncbi:hypothetical protein [Tautonia sociabilis]|uniref:hypothetical protein n=1 Tax=Tautonia sociabilis TaxID=2080755 RepID=UPI0018F6D7DD|nr:hypothetical protein [Tautonia sociabilis]
MVRKNATQPQGPEPLPADTPPPEEPRRPVQEFRLGRIKAVVWENETQLGTRYSVAFRRLYKDDATDQWRQSTSFNRDDLPLVAKVADLAHTWIFGQIQSDAPF